MKPPNLTVRNLATRSNALRVAQRLFDATGVDQAVVVTHDPCRRFIVEPHDNQADVIDAIIGVGADLDLICPCW
jgi:hypothetical protein